MYSANMSATRMFSAPEMSCVAPDPRPVGVLSGPIRRAVASLVVIGFNLPVNSLDSAQALGTAIVGLKPGLEWKALASGWNDLTARMPSTTKIAKHESLGDEERGFFLRRRQGVQERQLQERTAHPYKQLRYRGQHSGRDVDPAPGSREPVHIECDDRDRQHD